LPLDMSTYDYAGQVAWNRDSGVLWDRTRRRLRDRWPSVEYFIVREWQERGVLHVHVLLRIARDEAPDAAVLGDAARTAVATSNVDGTIVEWGDQSKCDAFRADGEGAKTIWYLSKALSYVMKDNAREGLARGNKAWAHLVALDTAARAIRCSQACVGLDCESHVHDRYGSRSHVVSASRRTRNRTGWSFTGLTRTVQRRLRREWFEKQSFEAPASSQAEPVRVQSAVEERFARLRREVHAQTASDP